MQEERWVRNVTLVVLPNNKERLVLVQYKMIKRHNLKHGDYETFPFYQCFLHQCHNRRFLANFVIGDEVGFALNGTVNNHIVQMYASANQPGFNYNVNDSHQKLTVWVGLCESGDVFFGYFI